jgi:Cu-Zn family superoxide dismutase
MRAGLLLAVLLLLAGCGLTSPSGPVTARAELRNAAGEPVGAADFTQIGRVVRIVMEVQGLPPGPKAVHVHEVGRCDPPGFTTAGGHFNPEDKQHGALNPRGPHAGDLPNVTVEANGTGRLEAASEAITLLQGRTSLFDADGSALVVHAAPDDFRTDPTGNAGPRLLCGVIVRPAVAR